jgi:GT2 family glycosyltransferase
MRGHRHDGETAGIYLTSRRLDLPMGMKETNDASSVTVITVTYGNRRHLLEPMLRRILTQEVISIILVDNGAHWDVPSFVAEIGDPRIEVISLAGNQGSAVGITTGLEFAIKKKAGLIWLLDDDNYPETGCLSELLRAYYCLLSRNPADRLGVVAFRSRFFGVLEQGASIDTLEPKQSAFWGFRLTDLPKKMWNRRPWRRTRAALTLPIKVKIWFAPYGGLMFHSSVINAIGLPKKELLLYEDDTEFSWRLTQLGGQIYLIPNARVKDIDIGWNETHSNKYAIQGWLVDGDAFRAYYRARNLTWFEMHCLPKSKLLYLLNKWVYLIVLFSLALAKGRIGRFNLLLKAIHDGANGHLSLNSDFRLP